MGHVKVRFLLDGKDIVGDSYSDKSYEVRAIYDKYSTANSRYGIYRFKDITTEGDDFVIDFNVEEIGDSIDWDKIDYPDERVRELIKIFIALHPIDGQLQRLLEEINRVNSETRYSLHGLGEKALDIIEKTPDSQYIMHNDMHKSEAREAINHTLDKEVWNLTSVKERDSKSSKAMAAASAVRHLISDISNFKRGMFWVAKIN